MSPPPSCWHVFHCSGDVQVIPVIITDPRNILGFRYIFVNYSVIIGKETCATRDLAIPLSSSLWNSTFLYRVERVLSNEKDIVMYIFIYIYIHFLSRLLWSVIKINRLKWFDRRTTVDSFEILKSYVVERPVYSRSLMKNFVCQNFGDNKFIVVSRWLYQWPRIVILMKPPFAICTEPLFDSDCVLFFKLNEHAGRCLTYTHKHPHTHINTQREREWER